MNPNQLTPTQHQVLRLIQQLSPVASLQQFCSDRGLDFNFVKGFVLSGLLQGWVEVTHQGAPQWTIAPKGQRSPGLVPGVQLVRCLQQGLQALGELQERLGVAFSVDYGLLYQEKGVMLQGDGAEPQVVVTNPGVLETVIQRQRVFESIAQGQLNPSSPLLPKVESAVHWLQDHGWITLQDSLDYSVLALPPLLDLDLEETSFAITALTSELLISQAWRSATFKPYDIQAEVPNITYGHASVLGQCIQRIRALFLHMGFDEMSGPLVESAFWNFDALFTPQDHPARDMQDTFYLAQPALVALPEDEALIHRVQQTHDRHYGGQWTTAEASRALLRAHTTPFTARKIYQSQGKPGKYFSIDRVFRNENIDRTHSAEFHQIEGVVIGELLTARTLMGYLRYFYEQLGFEQLRFKPTYNPYTEPSLEIHAYHEPSGDYVEVGNSGIFRREMLEALGCGEVSAIAWGLGLERIALTLYGVDRLADLMGPEITLS